jgi:transcriptional regulator with XRE-family HTH domain
MIKIKIEQGLTQKEPGEKIGTRQSNISRLESGQYNPSPEFLGKVPKGLIKSLSYRCADCHLLLYY